MPQIKMIFSMSVDVFAKKKKRVRTRAKLLNGNGNFKWITENDFNTGRKYNNQTVVVFVIQRIEAWRLSFQFHV